jgi:hypothetical protein
MKRRMVYLEMMTLVLKMMVLLLRTVMVYLVTLTKISLLNKPPRLGLSKLYRCSSSLHDVTIVEAEDTKVKYKQEVFIIEKIQIWCPLL